MGREAGAKKISQRARERIRARFDAEVKSRPGAPSRGDLTDANGAGFRKRVRLYNDLEPARQRLRADCGFAFPRRRTATDLLERSTEDLAELGRNI
ncbi:MAG: hypothetical protein ACERNK_04045 [Deltaproteobacteria bacterium]